VLDSNLILSDLNDFGESIRFIETSNRPIGTAIWPRDRAGGSASFAKSYLKFRVQIRNPRQNNDLRPRTVGTYRVIRRSYGSNKHVKMIQWAQDLVSVEREGANQGNGVLTDDQMNGFWSWSWSWIWIWCL